MAQAIPDLLTPPDILQSRRRVLEIVNAKFSCVEDLEGLESTAAQAELRNDELQQKLSLSHTAVDILIAETKRSAQAHLRTAQELSLLRHSLADELSCLSSGFVSSLEDGDKHPTLMEDVESLHRTLKELENVKGYVQIVQRALHLSESSITQFHAVETPSSASLAEYKSLNEFVSRVSQITEKVKAGAGEQRPRLVTLLEEIRDRTWADMRGIMTERLVSSAEKLQWPASIDYTTVSSEDLKAFKGAFLSLLTLQSLGESIHTTGPELRRETDGLYAMQALVQPLSLRFKYHFEGTRQTNRLDKPEWYFVHVLNAVHEHRAFMDTVVQSLLSSSEYRSINAWREFVLLLIPLLTRKIKRSMPSLLSRPSLLAHTIYQSLSFDAALTEEGFLLSGTSAMGDKTSDNDMEKWAGVSEVILGKQEWFDTWLAGEKKFTEDQYLEIISDPVAWAIMNDEGDNEESLLEKDFRTTNSARRIKALVEQVTDRYSPLPDYSHRTQFLISVQLPVLELYHSRISSSLDAFETLSSAFVRAVPGALGVSFGGADEGRVNVDAGPLTSGVDGVQRLCKALVSAKFIQMALAAWGEEVFFLELWSEINRRSSLRATVKGNSRLPKPHTLEAAVPEDAIFEELVGQYGKLIKRSEDMIVQQVCGETENSLRRHFAAMLSPNPTGQDTDIVLSHSLLGPIALLSAHLSLLRSVLSQTNLVSLYRRIIWRLTEHILQREILHRGPRQINVGDGKALLAEYELWVETCHAALNGVARSRVEAPWMMLLQAGRLLSVEGGARDVVIKSTFGACEDEEWEKAVTESVGVQEMGRVMVAAILRTREDCD